MNLQPPVSRKEALLSRGQIEGMIAEGGSIIIVNQKVLNVGAWLAYHPGGYKAIQHMIGRDATDEVTVLHSTETCASMSRYQIGRVQGRWKNFVPPIQGGTFREHVPESKGMQKPGCISGETSRVPSPTFDTESAAVRQRPEKSHMDNASLTSFSSVTESEDQGGPSFLDIQTRREILLDLSKYLALDEVTQDEIVRKYRLLHDQIHAEGLYQCNYMAYAWEFAGCATLFSLMLFFLRSGWYCTSGAFMGMFWSQLVFAAHDAGHMGITHNFIIDTMIGMIIAAPIGGLSLGWWKRTHNVHHIVTNSPEHDPDNQHLPVFAVNHRFLDNIFSTYHERLLPYDAIAKFLVPYQAVQEKGQLGGIDGDRWELFWLWFGYGIVYKSIPTGWNRFGFIMISHMINMPLHVQFTVSHFAMSTTDLGPDESFAQKMLRTTMDVDCVPWLDFFHGGLQFQAIHHLFPRVPRHNLRRTQKLVQDFCNDVNIPYALYGFLDGNKKVVGTLAEVSRQAAILAKCQRTIAQSGEIFHGN
ncbi:fatty acid desaturase [Coleophoma crateriformis]|uniref:Delta 8-(E)-sphingolipid desaturase n=1 Tax=Coleophoma crateriformis TaxID=565419 RepID=A0A3D8Q3R6_9HELO|nr:fatty acid desaturase [Coleophoma crateriformis]